MPPFSRTMPARYTRHSDHPPRKSDGWLAPTSRGQAIAEFALVAPVMMMMLLLAVDFGRLFFSYIAVSNAAREATFYAASHAGDSTFSQADYEAGVAQAAQLELVTQGQGGDGVITVSLPSCVAAASGTALACDSAARFAGGIGNHVSVSVSRPFDFLTPLIGDVFGGQLTVAASATAPVLNPPVVTVVADPDFEPPPTPSSTPTPTPTSTAEPSEEPTPTPTPSSTPTLTPPPTCTVPDFFNTYFYDIGAPQVWTSAGFTGSLTDASDGKKIKWQSLPARSVRLCSSDMTVRDQ